MLWAYLLSLLGTAFFWVRRHAWDATHRFVLVLIFGNETNAAISGAISGVLTDIKGGLLG